jgi:hypothetical protein
VLSKKHYEAIAKVLYSASDRSVSNTTHVEITNKLADYFEQDNPKFNRPKFMQAVDICQDVSDKKE